MPYIIDWNGNTISTTPTEALWSNKGGQFKSVDGKSTYFPLPIAYRSAINIVGSFTVTPQFRNRADMLANMMYNSVDYWWLVYWINGIIDPFASLNTGDVLLIADISQVNALLK